MTNGKIYVEERNKKKKYLLIIALKLLSFYVNGDQYDDKVPKSSNSTKEALDIGLFRLPNA